MKYVLKFSLKKSVFKQDYRRTIISFLKNALNEYEDGEFFEEMYDSGAKQKNFVWSIRLIKPKFKGEIIQLGESFFEMTFRFFDMETAVVYYTALLNQKGKEFNIGLDNKMVLEKLRLIREEPIVGNYAEFKVLSPICLKQHDKETNKDRYVTIDNDDFAMEFKRKLLEDMPEFEEKIQELAYDFSKLKVVMVKAFDLTVPATIGRFRVKGDEELLNKIKNRGVGSKRNAGFGLLEVN